MFMLKLGSQVIVFEVIHFGSITLVCCRVERAGPMVPKRDAVAAYGHEKKTLLCCCSLGIQKSVLSTTTIVLVLSIEL